MGQIVEKKRHFFMLDIIRIVCALIIFGRHAQTMAGFSFGTVLGPMAISMTSIVMTTFFILSDFSLSLPHVGSTEPFTGKKSIVFFYIKRLINILPIYYLVHVLWVVFFEENQMLGLIATPIEILGIQTVFSGVMGVLHNGGTWFVSCIILCYLIYPLLIKLLYNISYRRAQILLLISLVLYWYLPYYAELSGSLSLYTNPFARGLEFFIGIVLAIMKNKSIHNAAGTRTESIASIIILCILACFMFAAYYLGNVWMTNLSIIVVCLGIYYSTKIRCDALDNSRMLQYISSLTYPFYILQLLLWIPSLKIIEWLGIGDSKWDFMVAFILLIFMCILAHELYEKPIKKALKRKLLKG